MKTLTDRYQRHSISNEEQQLYDHLLKLVEIESPSQMLERFRCLFIDGIGYPDQNIVAILENLVASKLAEQDFKFLLNRCCHILINRWQMQPQLAGGIAQLVDLFDSSSSRLGGASWRTRNARRLHELIQIFLQSEQYLTIKRLASVINRGNEVNNTREENKPLGTLISRYPYLYSHCLLSEDSGYEHQQTVRQIQAQVQKQYEINLSQYVTYQIRRSRMAQNSSTPGQIIQTVKNPTLLSDRELFGAIKQFVGKAEGAYTYKDLAQSFLTHTSQTKTYGEFKNDFYEYLTSSIDPGYGKRQFNDRLYKQLQATLPQSDSQKLSDFLIVRTCSQILNFVVVDSPQQPNHFVFIDLMSNIGSTITTGLLLKIVLICRKVKPYLEKRFSILFNHYELQPKEGVQWLIKGLENVNLALSTHFGSLDLSFMARSA